MEPPYAGYRTDEAGSLSARTDTSRRFRTSRSPSRKKAVRNQSEPFSSHRFFNRTRESLTSKLPAYRAFRLAASLPAKEYLPSPENTRLNGAVLSSPSLRFL